MQKLRFYFILIINFILNRKWTHSWLRHLKWDNRKSQIVGIIINEFYRNLIIRKKIISTEIKKLSNLILKN